MGNTLNIPLTSLGYGSGIWGKHAVPTDFRNINPWFEAIVGLFRR